MHVLFIIFSKKTIAVCKTHCGGGRQWRFLSCNWIPQSTWFNTPTSSTREKIRLKPPWKRTNGVFDEMKGFPLTFPLILSHSLSLSLYFYLLYTHIYMHMYIICKENSSFIRGVIFESASDWRESFQTTCEYVSPKQKQSYFFTPLRNIYIYTYIAYYIFNMSIRV